MVSAVLQPDDEIVTPSGCDFLTVDRFIRGEIGLAEYVRLAGEVKNASHPCEPPTERKHNG